MKTTTFFFSRYSLYKSLSDSCNANLSVTDCARVQNFSSCCVHDPPLYYYYKEVLNISPSIDDVGDGVQYKLFGCLALAWIVCYFCIVRGVQSTGKVSIVIYNVRALFFLPWYWLSDWMSSYTLYSSCSTNVDYLVTSWAQKPPLSLYVLSTFLLRIRRTKSYKRGGWIYHLLICLPLGCLCHRNISLRHSPHSSNIRVNIRRCRCRYNCVV